MPLTLKSFLESLPAGQRQLVAGLRKLVLQATEGVQETILWKSLSYHRPELGGRVKGAVCLITPKADCVHLGFIHGAALPDPQRLLQGTTKAKRFIAFMSAAQLDRPGVKALIKAAASYCPGPAASP